MRHDRTIQGEPWEPCLDCPRRAEHGGVGDEGVCPSRRHRAHCERARAAAVAVEDVAAVLDRWRCDPVAVRDSMRRAVAAIEWVGMIRREPIEDRPGRGVEPPLPGYLSMAVGYSVATAEHIVAGCAGASDGLVAARLAVCREGRGLAGLQTVDGHCQHYRPSDDRCGKVGDVGCGCVLVQKARRLVSECPRDWWPRGETQAASS